MKDLISAPKTHFLKVLCKKCKKEQIIYSRAARVVKCLKCEEIIAIPTGGEAQIKAKVLEILT